MKKPRIAFIVPDQIQNPVGGMGVQAKYIIQHLESDFDFDIYAFPEHNNISNYHSCFNPLPKIMHPGLSTIAGQITYMTELFKNKKPDIIHVADYTLYLAGVMASRALSVPLIVSVQLSAHLMEQAGMSFAIDPKSIDGQAIQNTIRQIELLGLHEAQKIIHVSNMYKSIFAKEIPELDLKSVYIPNGIDLEDYSHTNPYYKKVPLPGNQKRKVIYIGRFSPQKNTEILSSVQIPENIDLIYIGKKEESNPLFQKVITSCRQYSNIHYYGPAYDFEKINLLHAADAVMIPSVHECHPIVMHEALAAGCVVIHSGAGDMSEVLQDDFAIDCGITHDSIQSALQNFATMSDDELLQRKNKSLEVVQNYTWTKAAKQTKDVYHSVLL
jgi:glycosyltransferase involved in cell wall biosynthesis